MRLYIRTCSNLDILSRVEKQQQWWHCNHGEESQGGIWYSSAIVFKECKAPGFDDHETRRVPEMGNEDQQELEGPKDKVMLWTICQGDTLPQASLQGNRERKMIRTKEEDTSRGGGNLPKEKRNSRDSIKHKTLLELRQNFIPLGGLMPQSTKGQEEWQQVHQSIPKMKNHIKRQRRCKSRKQCIQNDQRILG